MDSRNQPMQAFTTYIGGDARLWSPSSAQIARYYGQGCVNAIGQPVDPTNWGVGGTAQTDCRFFFNGDPVTGSGWLMAFSLDVKVLMSPDKFALAANEAQEVILAYVVAQGVDELDAITEIRQRADLAASIIGFNNTPVGIEPEDASGINSFQLRQNYPNPFNPSTTIEFTIQRNAFVELTVFNALGQQLETLQNGSLPAGNYQIPFNAGGLEAGVYFYRLKVDGQNSVRKMVYIP
ncbi:MAG: T9SS type A sorting domain-containing protein [Calditrichota bacterium]